MENSLLSSDKIEPIIFKLILTDTKYINVMEPLFKPSWFQDELIGKLVNIIIKYYSKYSKIPSENTINLLVSKIFQEQENYKEILIKTKQLFETDIETLDSKFIEKEVLNYLIGCGIFVALSESMDEIHKRHIAEEIVEKMRTIISMNFNLDLGLDYLENIQEHCDELKNPESRMSTGWDSLDDVTGGGMYKDGKCLILFLGQTHIGKSLILSNIAANLLKKDKFIIIITCEMSELVYATRIDAHLTLGNINNLLNNTEHIINVANKIKNKHTESKLIIKEFPPDSISCNHIQAHIEKIEKQLNRKPDAILIDYLGLLIPNSSSDNKNSYEKYKDVSTQMRALSYVFECPVVSVIQSNRQGADNTDLSLTNTAESYAIPQTADFIGSLYQREGEREAEIINIEILKNRLGGQIGKNLQFHINYINLKISDLETQIQQPSQVVDNVLNEINESLEDL